MRAVHTRLLSDVQAAELNVLSREDLRQLLASRPDATEVLARFK